MNATRFTLVWLSYWFDWEPALTIVQPQTFKRWRRQGWRLLWKTPARLGRPPIPPKLQALIRRMAQENVIWGQKRIANELLLKLGLRVSPRTVRKYMPSDCVGSPGRRCQAQRWSTFICNHTKGLVVTGITAEVAQRARAMLARIQRIIPRLTHWALPRALGPIKAHNQLVVFSLDDSFGKPGISALNRAEHMQRVERSPPETGLSQHPEPVSAVPAVPAARVEVCLVIPGRCWRALLIPIVPEVASPLSGVIRSDLLPRAA